MTVKIRDLVIGEEMPKICVPVMGKKKEDIYAAAIEAVKRKSVNIVEWRADDFEDVFKKSAVSEVLENLRKILGNIPLLVTFRTRAEGGRCEASSEAYFDFLETVTASGKADMLDIELLAGDIAEALEKAKSAGLVTVVSNHEFFKTPSKQCIVQRLRQMERLGADIAKMAVMPEKAEDVLTLLSATLEAKEVLSCPIVTMSMGQLGLVSRLCGQQFGSAITFGLAGEASAPGQIDADSLYAVLKLFAEKEGGLDG